MVATPALAAGSPTFVSQGEFNQIRNGMAMKQVHRIFEVPGKQTSYDSGYPGKYGWPATRSRDYRVKSKWGSVTVNYNKVNGTWKVTGKSAYWGTSPAGTRGYVTRPEFTKVGKGMTMSRTHSIFGAAGVQTSYDSGLPGKYGWPATQSRDYRVASKWGWVTVDYKYVNGAWKITGKSAYWG